MKTRRVFYHCTAFVISIIASVTSAVPADSCPPSESIPPCRCSFKENEMQIWCSHSNLPQIMEGIKSVEKNIKTEIDELILENNQLLALPGRFFGNLQLMRLMLRHNGIERLSTGWLNELAKNSLVEIYIVEPNLRSVPFESLSGLVNLQAVTIQSQELKHIPNVSDLLSLKYLNIQSGSLADLPGQIFRNLPKLTEVHINGGTSLTRLDTVVFDSLISLQNIDLSRNGISWIHLRAFTNLPNLVSLKLSQNQINNVKMIGRVIKDIESLKKLRLDKNFIETLPEGCFVDLPNLTELHLNDNRISAINYGAFLRTPNLKMVYLHNNRITQIHPESFLQSSGSGVESLYIYNNQINRIEELRSILNALPALKFLDISNNHIQSIQFGALRGHGTLEQLYMNNNEVSVIEKDALMAMPALRELRLRNNSLSHDLAMPVWNLPALKGLDVSYNLIRQVDALFLAGLPSLRRLELSHNSLESMDRKTFLHTPMLETLNISFNKLEEIHEDTFRALDRLFEVDAAFNELSDLIPGLPGVVERVSMRGNKIVSLQLSKPLNLPSLRMLDLSENLLESLPKFAFKSMKKLRVLSLAFNHLRLIDESTFIGPTHLELLQLQNNVLTGLDESSFLPLPHLRSLNLLGNRLDTITDNLFSKNTELEMLDLSRNELKWISPTAFQSQQDLNYLDLSSNKLKHFPESLASLTNLHDVDLSNNEIADLPADVISHWENVIEMRVSNNRITELKASNLYNLTKLQYVDLSSNEIYSIEPGAIRNLPDLQELVLADNKIVELKDHVFDNLPNLLAMHLQHNLLKFVSPESFSGSYGLLFLNMSSNQFRSLENAGLRNLRNLEVLDVSNNFIRVVSSMPLQVLNWLVELKMERNQICKIHGTPFDAMPRLRVLSVRQNKLRRMEESIFRNLRGNLAILNVDGNPLTCDCTILWLSVWMDETNFAQSSPICQDGKQMRSARFYKSECSDQRSTSNHLPLYNDHGDLFGRQLSTDFHDECEGATIEFQEDNKRRPLPAESEYFYDQYIDFPGNETHDIATDSFNKKIESNATPPFTLFTTRRPALDLNDTILNTKIYTRNPIAGSPTQSPFTFFGYPLPNLNIGKFFGSNSRKSERSEKTRSSTSKGNLRVHPTMDADVEKYINQESQYHDVTARNRFTDIVATSSAESAEEQNFKTSFRRPSVEVGGFKPIVHSSERGGFIPVQPVPKNKTFPTPSYEVNEESFEERKRKFIPAPTPRSFHIPSTTSQPVIFRPTTDNTVEILSTAETQRTTQIAFLDVEDLTTPQIDSLEDFVFPPSSTSPTILLIPPSDEVLDIGSSSSEEQPTTTFKPMPNSVQERLKQRNNLGRSTITKVFTSQPPVSNLNLPTAEEYFRTTEGPAAVPLQTEHPTPNSRVDEQPEEANKPGMDWYYENYKKADRKTDHVPEWNWKASAGSQPATATAFRFIVVIFIWRN